MILVETEFLSGKRALIEYEIQEEVMEIDNSEEFSQVEIKIVFRRSKTTVQMSQRCGFMTRVYG